MYSLLCPLFPDSLSTFAHSSVRQSTSPLLRQSVLISSHINSNLIGFISLKRANGAKTTAPCSNLTRPLKPGIVALRYYPWLTVSVYLGSERSRIIQLQQSHSHTCNGCGNSANTRPNLKTYMICGNPNVMTHSHPKYCT